MNSPAQCIIAEIKKLCDRQINLMEVCGTHTMAIAAAGIRNMMPGNLKLLSGPGCPVCVTPLSVIDHAIELARQSDMIITTFGDMVRVPGSRSSLEIYHPRIVYSARDALVLAEQNPGQEIIFIGIGFETTSPSIAATIMEASKKKVKNFSVLPAVKSIPPALDLIARSRRINVHGLILPGHVSTIIGTHPYQFLAGVHHIPGCVTGFEPIDILQGILDLVRQIVKNEARIDNEYARVVKPEGNQTALTMLARVFVPADSEWRGIGVIPGSGLAIRAEYRDHDASRKFKLKTPISAEPKGCICGKVLLGLKTPAQCALFGKKCTPASPVGACMVSSEGSCAAYYRYGLKK
ncbi:MAG TPA: hydrogenase formation protein HypD [bacterium]